MAVSQACAGRDGAQTAPARSAALKTLASEVFGDATFANVEKGIGVVTANGLTEQHMIFKGNVS